MTHRDLIVDRLLHGHYITFSHGKLTLYKVGSIPIRRVQAKTFSKIGALLKKDKKGRYTFNLTAVRALHGNDKINRAYKRMKHEQTHHQYGCAETGAQDSRTGNSGKACYSCTFQLIRADKVEGQPGGTDHIRPRADNQLSLLL